MSFGGPPPRRWRWRWLAPVAAAALGALQTLAFVHTAWWPLPLLALAAFVMLLDAASPRRAAFLGWCYGTAWLAAGTWWLFISMHRYGGLPAPLAGAAVFALSAALSIYLALACAAYARWRRGRGWDVALFTAVWLLAELARGVLFTGFPWVAAGYALVDSPLAALAPWLGVYGMGAVMAALAAGAVGVLHAAHGVAPVRGAALALALPLGLLLAAVAAPADFTQPTGRLRVALLQTNVAQDEKFSAERLPESLAWVARGLVEAEAELVVAPETAVPLLPGQLEEFAPGYWQMLQQHFSGSSTTGPRAALVGVPLGDFERGYTNSVAGLTARPSGTAEYRYDKHHLVPFGEFIPTGFRWFTQMMNIPLGDFSRGGLQQPSFAVRGQRVAPNICYEDLFGEELAQRFADPATAPTVMANLSNIGWFGNTIAIPQHLNISRLRTLELQRPMLRATNTGATAVVDHRGVVTAQMAPHTRGVLNAGVQGREGLTPFAWWASRFGLAPLLGLALLLGAAAVVAGRRRPRP